MRFKELFTMTQEEKIQYIIDYLDKNNISYKIDENGNIWGINFPDRVCFVSHMDTVAYDDYECRKPVFECDGILFKINAVLGADDTAGNILMLNHIDKINFIFTTDEEVGCIGAKKLASNEEFLSDINVVSGFIELDRKGSNDIIGYTHGYCKKDFLNAIKSVLPDYNDVKGVLTDIDKFIHIKPGVNLSVGYYNAHSTSECLDLNVFYELDDKIEALANISGTYEPIPKKSIVKTAKKYDGFGRHFVKCDVCGEYVSFYETEDINGKVVCFDCIDEMMIVGDNI